MRNNTKDILDENKSNTTMIGGLATNHTQEYISPTPGEIPLVAYGVIPANLYSKLVEKNQNDPENIDMQIVVDRNFKKYKTQIDMAAETVRECGFNCVVLWGGLEQTSKVMEQCLEASCGKSDKCNLPSIFLLNPSFRESYANTNDMIDFFEGKEYPRMYIVQDEPQYNDWGQVIFGIKYRDAINNDPDTPESSKIDFAILGTKWNNLIKAYSYLVERGGCWVERMTAETKTVTEYRKTRRPVYFNLACCYDYYNASFDKWVNDLEKIQKWSPFSAGSKDTPQYLEVMKIMFRPPVWSYDFYPFRFNKTAVSSPVIPDSENEWKDVPGVSELKLDFQWKMFYYQLEKFEERSRLDNRPFYAYCMTAALGDWNVDAVWHNGITEQKGKYESFLPWPTLGMLRFSAFNALASGAQGLVFFTYAQGWGTDSEKKGVHPDIFYTAPLKAYVPADTDAEANPASDVYVYKDEKLWQTVHSVLTDIKKLNNVFLNTNVIDLGHFVGEHLKEAYAGLREVNFQSGPFGPLVNIGMSQQGPGVFLSWLRTPADDGSSQDYVLVLNHDPFNSQKSVDVFYDSGYKLKTVYGDENLYAPDLPPVVPSEPVEGEAEAAAGGNAPKSSSISINLPPGGMHVFKVTRL